MTGMTPVILAGKATESSLPLTICPSGTYWSAQRARTYPHQEMGVRPALNHTWLNKTHIKRENVRRLSYRHP